MTPQQRRRLIPLIVFLASTGVLLAIILGPKRADKKVDAVETTSTEVASHEETTHEVAYVPKEEPIATPKKDEPIAPPSKEPVAPFAVLHVKQHDVTTTPIVLGALDDIKTWQMEVCFTQTGAGISSIQFSNIFENFEGYEVRKTQK